MTIKGKLESVQVQIIEGDDYSLDMLKRSATTGLHKNRLILSELLENSSMTKYEREAPDAVDGCTYYSSIIDAVNAEQKKRDNDRKAEYLLKLAVKVALYIVVSVAVATFFKIYAS